MANTTLRPKYYSEAINGLGLFVLLIIMQRAGATEFKVGGANGIWSVPPNASLYNQWAESNRFRIGDSLLFVYLPDKDSVLQVNKDAYTNCTTDSPIQTFNDGYTSFVFNQSGPYYFISGVKENCLKNEKILVIVMAQRSITPSPPSQTGSASPPSPPPPEATSPPEISPSTPPTGEQIPPPPPPPPNGASTSMIVSYMGLAGILGSTLFFL